MRAPAPDPGGKHLSTMEVSKSNAGLLNPLFQATQLGVEWQLTEVPGLRRAPRDGTWILQMDTAAKSGRDPRGVCAREGGRRWTRTHPHPRLPHVPATPSEKDQGKKKYGSATLRGQSGLPAPVTAAHPQRKLPVAFPLQWLGRVVDCLVRQGRCDSVAVRARHWLLHLKCGWRLPPCSCFFHAPVPRLI